MNRLVIRKGNDSVTVFADGQRLFAGSPYEVKVYAREFRDDVRSPAAARLFSGRALVAECPLAPDPLRRGVRVSSEPLAVPAFRDDARGMLYVSLGDAVIMAVPAAVTGIPDGSVEPASGSRWTEVDLGKVATGRVEVADMTQVKLSAPDNATALSVVPIESEGSFEAYVVVVSDRTVPFPFTGVTVGGSAPVWSHQDSFLMPSTRWTLRLAKVAGEYYADFRAGRAGGAEIDPDGATVVSAEVNR